MVQIKILDRRLGSMYKLPEYETPGAAAVDLRMMGDKKIHLMPDESYLCSTGISISMEPEMAAIILPRSSWGCKGLNLNNSVGLIDPDYQGVIKLSLVNRGRGTFSIDVGDRVAQMMFLNFKRVQFEVVNEFNTITQRGQKGFGSTGKR